MSEPFQEVMDYVDEVIHKDVIGHNCCVLASRFLVAFLRVAGFRCRMVGAKLRVAHGGTCVILGSSDDWEVSEPKHCVVIVRETVSGFWYMIDSTVSQVGDFSKRDGTLFPRVNSFCTVIEDWGSVEEPGDCIDFYFDGEDGLKGQYLANIVPVEQMWCYGSPDMAVTDDQIIDHILQCDRTIKRAKADGTFDELVETYKKTASEISTV